MSSNNLNNSTIDLGVYFGGSSMVIAYGKPTDSPDKVSVIVNESGDRSTPAVVALNSNEYSVGLPAKQNLIRNSINTILYAKHMIGKSLEQIDTHFVEKLACQVGGFLDYDSVVVFKTIELTLDYFGLDKRFVLGWGCFPGRQGFQDVRVEFEWSYRKTTRLFER